MGKESISENKSEPEKSPKYNFRGKSIFDDMCKLLPETETVYGEKVTICKECGYYVIRGKCQKCRKEE